MSLSTRRLGLAAYIKMHGTIFRGYENGAFLFEAPDDRTIEDWHIEYMNSCCQTHDSELVTLRDLMPKRGKWD